MFEATETYLWVVFHPMLWIFLGLTATFFLVQWLVTPRPEDSEQSRGFDTAGWMRRNYVAIVFALGGAAIVAAIYFYVVDVGLAVARLVDRLRIGAAGDLTPEEAKNLAYGIAVLLGALVAAATIPFTLLRTWINERSTTAQEQGLITDRINKAVEGLGAEKAVSRVWRNIQVEENGVTRTYFEGRDQTFAPPAGAKVIKYGDWQVAERTKPNLEVRIDAIYALERISQDSARDHIQIMEILCAYIRQNAPVETASPLKPNNVSLAAHCVEILGGSTPRSDVQAAISVIARRSPARRMQEKSSGYILDLRNCNLQNTRFSTANTQADWSDTIFNGSNLDQADFGNSDCSHASFQQCSLGNPTLQSAELKQANFRHATFKYIHFHKKGSNFINWNIFENADTMATNFEFCVFAQLKIENQFHTASLRNCRFVRCRFTHAWFFQPVQGFEQKNCIFAGCAVRNFDLQPDISVNPDLSDFFGDGSVTVPKGMRPEHWPKQQLDDNQFETEWRKWIGDRENYTPPDPPSPET